MERAIVLNDDDVALVSSSVESRIRWLKQELQKDIDAMGGRRVDFLKSKLREHQQFLDELRKLRRR